MFRKNKPKPIGIYSHFKRTLNCQEIEEYIQNLNYLDKEVGKETNTNAFLMPTFIKEHQKFILVLLSYEILPENGDTETTKRLVESSLTIAQIPPIIVGGYSKEKINTIDGFNRASFSKATGNAIFGYVPEKILKMIPNKYYKIL